MGAFLVEGTRAVSDAVTSGAPVTDVFLTEEYSASDVQELADGRDLRIHVVSDRVAKSLSDSVTPQGIVAVVRTTGVGLEELSDADFVLVVDGVADPGNAGTLIRTAAAAGMDAVVFPAGSVDPFSPKCVRGAAAALFSVEVVVDVSFEHAIEWAKARGMTVVGTDMDGAPYYETDLTGSLCLVAGNEGWGIDPTHEQHLDITVGIPMDGRIESLNVSSAMAVIIFEAAKQRRLSSAARRNGA